MVIDNIAVRGQKDIDGNSKGEGSLMSCQTSCDMSNLSILFEMEVPTRITNLCFLLSLPPPHHLHMPFHSRSRASNVAGLVRGRRSFSTYKWLCLVVLA